MGLGKTIQVLALLLVLHRQSNGNRQPSLLVAPASLLANWASEIEHFAPAAFPLASRAQLRRAAVITRACDPYPCGAAGSHNIYGQRRKGQCLYSTELPVGARIAGSLTTLMLSISLRSGIASGVPKRESGSIDSCQLLQLLARKSLRLKSIPVTIFVTKTLRAFPV
jgi:hypothetical protein